MGWDNIHVDDYGWVGKLCIKQDGTVVDISSFTTRSFILRSPAGTATTKTATFTTDGTDGYLQYTIADGNINVVGKWSVAARISKTSVELTSKPVTFLAIARTD